MQGDKALLISLAVVKPFEENYNKHPQPQIELLKKSLARYGAYKPVVVWRNPEDSEYRCLAGHGVIEAAMQLGWSEIWANDRSDLSHTEARALVAADNEIARRAEPDMDDLSQLIAAVNAEDESLAALAAGGEDELRRLLELAGEETVDHPELIDKAAELQAKWQVQPGDLWICGAHRVVCGDCTEAAVVAKVMQGEKAGAVITDPPFGTKTAEWDKLPDLVIWKSCKQLCTKGPIAVFGYAKQLFSLAPLFEDMALIGFVVWYKYNEPMISPGLTRVHQDIAIWGSSLLQCHADRIREPYQFLDENAKDPRRLRKFFGSGSNKAGAIGNRLKGAQMNPDGRRCQDLWVIAVNYHGFNVHLRQHPNQKPDELMERLVLLLSNEDTIIFDPFLGSGTTMVAAQRLGRVCRGIEIEPSYVAVTLERMKGLGLDPVLVKEPAS